MRTLEKLAQWGFLMASLGLLLIAILESTKAAVRVKDFSGYLKTIGAISNQLIGYSIMVFGYSFIIFVRRFLLVLTSLSAHTCQLAHISCSCVLHSGIPRRNCKTRCPYCRT